MIKPPADSPPPQLLLPPNSWLPMRMGQEGTAPPGKCHSARTLVGSGHALAWTKPASFCPCPFLLTAPLSPSRGSCQGEGGGAGRGGLDGHPTPTIHSILSLWEPATGLPMKGRERENGKGWWKSQLESLGVRKRPGSSPCLPEGPELTSTSFLFPLGR